MDNANTIEKAIQGSLNIIEQDREREIISRRFGLSGQKETLEQIGDLLNITRERVRQLEKKPFSYVYVLVPMRELSKTSPPLKNF